jgi:hypothetical protein
MLFPYECECVTADKNEDGYHECFSRNRAKIDALKRQYGEDAVRLVIEMQAGLDSRRFPMGEFTEDEQSFVAQMQAEGRTFDFQVQVQLETDGSLIESLPLTHVTTVFPGG